MVCTANEIECGHHKHQTVQFEPVLAFIAAWKPSTVVQPVEFTAGLDVGSGGVKQPAGEGAGGLFSGASGPKPPAALSQAVLGMKPGGKVSETPMTLMSFSLLKHWCVVKLVQFCATNDCQICIDLKLLASHVHLSNLRCSLHMTSCCQVCMSQACY